MTLSTLAILLRLERGLHRPGRCHWTPARNRQGWKADSPSSESPRTCTRWLEGSPGPSQRMRPAASRSRTSHRDDIRWPFACRASRPRCARRRVGTDATVTVTVTMRVALSADVLVTGTRTFRSLTDMDEPVNGLLGLAEAGSVGVVTAKEIEERPVFRSGEVYEAVPGVVISQHSGEGKANQYYVRGFNIDHGTDLATWVAGAPVNMPTHAHGQGYSDNNFLIPEPVSGVQYQKGTYSAEEGDFSAAGAINVNYLNVLDHRIAKVEGGHDRFGRVLFAASSKIGRGNLLYAGEAYHSDGPWVRGDNYRKWNGILRFSKGDQQNGVSLTAMGYSGRWNSTDQVPERALASGLIDRFGSIDPTDAGNTHRYTLAGEWRKSTGAGLTLVKAYGIDVRARPVRASATSWTSPVHGDQFEQEDERSIVGGSVSQRFLRRWFGRDTASSVAGLQGRFDHIPTLGLYHTEAGQRLDTIRQDRVNQSSGALFFQTSIQWTPKVRTVAGLRRRLRLRGRDADAANTDAQINPRQPEAQRDPGAREEHLSSRQLGLGVSQQRRPRIGADPGPQDGRSLCCPWTPSSAPRAPRWECAPWPSAASTAPSPADAGHRLGSRPSSSVMRELRGQPPSAGALASKWSNVYTPTPWLTLDADVAYSKARFRDDDPAGDRIPGAVEGVVSAGVTAEGKGPFSASLRLRYFGALHPRSSAPSAIHHAQCSPADPMTSRYTLALHAFNSTNAKVSDVDYYYASRLQGELGWRASTTSTRSSWSRSRCAPRSPRPSRQSAGRRRGGILETQEIEDGQFMGWQRSRAADRGRR